ncbi:MULTISPECIES: carbamoyl phosphate synthase small subunit [Bacillus]|uniref:Carbamoyl phosphate synthase small chain n=2 Tax=Bacillus TaxID=1386 RepID=A0A0M4FVH9_9BACI|nr:MULTISPECIES: carbamoyl phosphate synthase small subunit [Bacillus]ALC80713.1 carbamoyl phosphate synthase small subunit [Bacillus gobiensis]MBP1079608.1 carbamoyl-phosphate synthase small subunit [Bacillus capparidis]MED1095009.1 carbamoyl phosphate synthase small subunit [Bacillus capparidis]
MEGYLVLEDGTSYNGEIETEVECSGEIVFFTGMTGYQEVLTDPSYKGQIVVFTYPLIGNYGINKSDFESMKPQVKAVVVYEATDHFSHCEAEMSLREYLKKWNIPLITHVDSRAVVKKIRSKGTMSAMISASKDAPSFEKEEKDQNVIEQVAGNKEISTYDNGSVHIAVIDFGSKKSIITRLIERGCKVTVIPYHQLESVEQISPDGIVLSNGPGDPKVMEPYLKTLKKLLIAYPSLGICLGHQLIALAFGGNTYKLPFGHRGANHPVIDKDTKKVFMTSQNHSYVVDKDSLQTTDFDVRFYNVNDGSVEGLYHTKYSIMSVQFHPEANPGPVESEWIFDDYLQKLKAGRKEIAHV